MNIVDIMINKIQECPICKEKMYVNQLKCPKCHISIEGSFGSCQFCALPEEQHEFLKLYLRCEGNIKKIEKILGISYPTVKSKIDELLGNLRLAPVEDTTDVLDALEKGTMTVDDVVTILKQRKR